MTKNDYMELIEKEFESKNYEGKVINMNLPYLNDDAPLTSEELKEITMYLKQYSKAENVIISFVPAMPCYNTMDKDEAIAELNRRIDSLVGAKEALERGEGVSWAGQE